MAKRALKCVGGPADGKKRDVALTEIGVIVVSMAEPLPAGIADVWTLDDTLAMIRASSVKTTYIVRCIRLGGAVFEYLAPEDWTDMQAIQHQFSK